MSSSYNPKQAQAIPFIMKNAQNQNYELSKQAQSLLKSLKYSISIVTVAGLYRTGKSYLLNRVILNKNNGFNVGPTINPCTKGLWIWNEPICTQDNKYVMVVDTQGLGALDQQTNHDMKIFSLAVLLSTTFIYNSVGNIDENALQTLSLVLNLVQNIDQDNQSTRPSFIWVVRDFSLQLIDQNGNTISPKQYLQMALNSDTVNKDKSKVSIRNTITKAFSDRNCFTLYKPLIDENKLQRLDQVPMQELRPEFVSQTMALRKTIFSNLKQIKLANSNGLSGSQFVIMIQKYLGAINQGKVPNMTDTWTFIKEQKNRQVTEKLINVYSQKAKTKIVPKLPMKPEALQQILKEYHTEIFKEFNSSVYEQSDNSQLTEFFNHLTLQVKKINQQQIRQFKKNLFNKEYEGFAKKLYSDFYQDLEQYLQDINKSLKATLMNEFSLKVPNLQGSLAIFLEKKITQAFKYFDQKQRLQTKRISQNKTEIEQTLKRQLQMQKSKLTSYNQQLKGQIQVLDRKVIELQQLTFDNQRSSVQEKDELIKKQSQLKRLISASEEKYLNLETAYESLKKDKSILEKQTFMKQKQFQKVLALNQQKKSHLEDQLLNSQAKFNEARDQLQSKIEQLDIQRKSTMQSFQVKMKSLIEENKQKSQKIFQLENLILEQREQLTKMSKTLTEKEKRFMDEKQKVKETLISDFSNKKQSHSYELEELRQELSKAQQKEELNRLKKEQHQVKLKQATQELYHLKHSSDKEVAIHLQKIQFQESEIKELKTALQEQKKKQNSLIETIQSGTRASDEKYQTKINELIDEYQTKLKTMQKDLSQKYLQIKKQYQQVLSTKENLQINFSVQKQIYHNKQNEFKEQITKYEETIQKLCEKVNNSEKDFRDINQETQSFYSVKIKKLQSQIEENKQKYTRQLEENQKSSEQALSVLKNYAQKERQQWQKRLSDEKDKTNKKLSVLKDQYQKKMLEQKQILQDENVELSEKINDMERLFTQTMQNFKYDHSIQIQKLNNQFMEEKVELNKKNALLNQQSQLTKLNLESQLQQNKKQFEVNLKNIKEQLQSEISAQQVKFREEKQYIQTKYQTLKKANRNTQQQNLLLKNQMDKQKSLYKEKQSHHLKSIGDLEQRLSQQLLNHTKTLQELNNSHNQERKRLNSQIENYKNIKSNNQREIYQLDQQKKSLLEQSEEKIKYLQTRIKSKTVEYDDLMNKFTKTNQFLGQKLQQARKDKAEVISKTKLQFQQQIAIKQQNVQKQIKGFKQQIYRLTTDNKSLRQKVTLLQLRQSEPRRDIGDYQNQFQEFQEMKNEYMQRESQYKRTIERLKKEIKRINEEKQILELNNGFQKQKRYRQTKQRTSERDSIINALNQECSTSVKKNQYNNTNNKFRASNLDSSKLTMNQSQLDNSRLSALGQNKAYNNRPSYLTGNQKMSPLIGNKNYTQSKNMRVQDCDRVMRYK